jgi:hypothetical protein
MAIDLFGAPAVLRRTDTTPGIVKLETPLSASVTVQHLGELACRPAKPRRKPLQKNLIAQIQKSGPDDDYFDAKVKVLSEMISHHVNEEEQRGGMFAQAKQSDLDLKSLGEQLLSRKRQLMAGEG